MFVEPCLLSLAKRATGIPGNALRRRGSASRDVMTIQMLRASARYSFVDCSGEVCDLCGGAATLILRPIDDFVRMVRMVWVDRAGWVVETESGRELVHLKCDVETIEHLGDRALVLNQALQVASELIDLNRCGLFRKRLDRLNFEDWAAKRRAEIARRLDAMWCP